MTTPLDNNRQVWDDRVRQQKLYAVAAKEEDFKDPLAVVDQCRWLGDVKGKRLLCLAAGGGRHSALFATAGAKVTVVDLSPAMLELDRAVAKQRGLDIEIVEASMDNLSMLPEAEFEIVLQPVSTCYVPDVRLVYQQVARVTAPGGIYVSQHKQPVNLQADVIPLRRGYSLNEPYFRKGPLPQLAGEWLHRESGATEFLHRWEELIGGLCRAGFVLEDLMEPRHEDANAPQGSWGHRSLYVPPYVKLKARRLGEKTSKLWVP